jgi:hypothetical protein
MAAETAVINKKSSSVEVSAKKSNPVVPKKAAMGMYCGMFVPIQKLKRVPLPNPHGDKSSKDKQDFQ